MNRDQLDRAIRRILTIPGSVEERHYAILGAADSYAAHEVEACARTPRVPVRRREQGEAARIREETDGIAAVKAAGMRAWDLAHPEAGQ